jgi:hypothetical protein
MKTSYSITAACFAERLEEGWVEIPAAGEHNGQKLYKPPFTFVPLWIGVTAEGLDSEALEDLERESIDREIHNEIMSEIS